MERTAAYWKEKLNLTAHVEGGAFRETYRAPLTIAQPALGEAFKGDRNASTCIYFLLEHGEFSALHRIAADETWHFYDGGTLHIYEIKPDGTLVHHKLGLNLEAGEQPQATVSAGSWFGSRVEEAGSFTLCGCTVAPGFDFEDFELGDRMRLSLRYPKYSGIVAALTR